MLKKVLSIFLTAFISLTFFSVGASAAISTYAISSAYRVSSLSISGNKAICKSSYEDVTTAKIYVVQTLEKHWGLWIWNSVDGVSWSKTVNASRLSFTNNKNGLEDGTYRLKTDFTVTTSSGQSETITVYSSEVTI